MRSALRRHRERAGLSQEALARQVGVSRQTVVNMEQGTNEPRVLLALRVAQAVGVDVGVLFRPGVAQGKRDG